MMSDSPSVACGREKARDFGFSGRTRCAVVAAGRDCLRERLLAVGGPGRIIPLAGGWLGCGRRGVKNCVWQKSHLADHRWGFSFRGVLDEAGELVRGLR